MSYLFISFVYFSVGLFRCFLSNCISFLHIEEIKHTIHTYMHVHYTHASAKHTRHTCAQPLYTHVSHSYMHASYTSIYTYPHTSCVRACTHIYINVCTCTYIHMHTRASYVHIQMRMLIQYARTNTCLHTHMCTHTHICTYIHMHLIHTRASHAHHAEKGGSQGPFQQEDPGPGQGEAGSHRKAGGRQRGRGWTKQPPQPLERVLRTTWPTVTASTTSWPPYGEALGLLHPTPQHPWPPHLASTLPTPCQEDGCSTR